jgi:hypothetical protein
MVYFPMRTKIEIQKEIDKLKEELAQVLEVGDLVCVQPTREWRKTLGESYLGFSYVAIVRIDHISHNSISGEKIEIREDVDITGGKSYGSYTFDKNVFTKITI